MKSLHERMRSVERELSRIVLTARELEKDRAVLDALHEMELAAHEAQQLIREYEYAETRQDQLASAKELAPHFVSLQQNIIIASQHDLLGPADVAQLSSELHALSESVQ